ncbi:chromatin modification- protein VID21, partial [Coemansia sp. RSA 2399]
SVKQDSVTHHAASRSQLEKEQNILLQEYYFWTHSPDSDIAQTLAEANLGLLDSIAAKEDYQKFRAMYANDAQAALSSMREFGESIWKAGQVNQEQQPPEIDGKKGVVANNEPMDIDADNTKVDAREKESVIVETLHTMHPDDVVFLSQLDPVPVAEVTDGYPVKDAEMLEHSMLYQAYCDQLNDINCKSVSMYNWMLHSQEQSLCDLTKSTDKLLSTRDWDAVRDEIIRVRVMERIEELKDKGKWSFLQPRKHRAPPRSKAHWDYLLDEMTWMHTDFAEERKLRVAMARMISSWVMDYHHARDKSLYI